VSDTHITVSDTQKLCDTVLSFQNITVSDTLKLCDTVLSFRVSDTIELCDIIFNWQPLKIERLNQEKIDFYSGGVIASDLEKKPKRRKGCALE